MEEKKFKTLEDYKDVAFLCASSCLNCIMTYPSFQPSCPSKEKYEFMSYSSKGRSGLIQGYLAGKMPLSESFVRIIYSCALCGACRAGCQQDWKKYNLEVFEAMREEILEQGKAPPLIRDFLKSIQLYGNPYKEPQENRGKWAEGLVIKEFSGDEYLYYVGSVGSYDQKAQKGARALAEVLLKAGVSFGILGSAETCDGNEVNKVGEKGLFEFLAESNIQKFNELRVKKIVTLSPHAYNAFKNEYPKFGGNFEVVHYTQLLSALIGEGKITMPQGFKARVTYHDPCFLGRHNEEYEAPRNILKAIGGIDLLEMERSGETSFCCGGGGGNFVTDYLGGGEKAANRIRVREAVSTGAEILAVACPICATMLEDALKAEEIEDRFKVMDIAEIVKEAM